MKKLIIGALVLLISIPGFSFNFFNFLNFLAGLIPVLLILGGALAVYLGLEELKQSDTSDSQETAELPEAQQEQPVHERADKPVADTQPANLQPQAEEKSADTPLEQQLQQDAPSAPAPDSQDTEPAVSEGSSIQFKGNIETLVFHSVTCNFASGKNCSMDFTSKEEAEAQGYKPCKICMPDD